MEISKELKKHPELKVRMGIHSGPVNEITDLNEQANIAGAGINVAERVMDCGDAGHILLSQHVADDLEQYPRWRPFARSRRVRSQARRAATRRRSLRGCTWQRRAPRKSQQAEQKLNRAQCRIDRRCSCWPRSSRPAEFTFSRARCAAITEKSIAVLPLMNSSRDPAQRVFL